jgi:RND family efflux transporter MFP subunit
MRSRMQKKMNFKTVLSVLFIAVAMLAGTFVFGAQGKAEKCAKTVKVVVEEVQPTSFQEYKMLAAKIKPIKTADISSPIPAAVKSVETSAGSSVKAGDVLVNLDSDAIKKELDDAAANLNNWKKKLYRYEHWKERSTKAEANAKKNIEEFSAIVAKKQEELKNTIITAPFDGKVETLAVKEGDHISAGFVLGTLVNTQKVIVGLGDFSDKVADGQKIAVKVKELNTVAKALVREKGGKAYIIIPNPQGQIEPGMTAHFKVLVKKHDKAVVLAKDVIQKDDTGTFVYVVNGKVASKVKVDVAAVTGNNVLIKEGVSFGNEVVVAEVFEAKKGTVKDELVCLKDNKKIKVMVLDEAKGKYVKRKKGQKATKPVLKKEKPVKKKPVAPPPPPPKKKKKVKKEVDFGKKIRLGVFGSISKMSDSNFDDFYGQMNTFGIDLSYMLSQRMDLWLTAGTGSKTATIPELEADSEFKYTPITASLRYYLVRGNKLDLYAGAGLNIVPMKDTSPLAEVSETAIGFNVLAGTYYRLTNSFSLQLALRYNSVKKTIELEDMEVDNDLDLSGMELLFGISISF